MTDNVAEDIPIFDRYQYSLGPLLLTWDARYTNPLIPSLRITLVPLIGIGYAIGDGGQFDALRSITHLTPIFSRPFRKSDIGAVGLTIGNVIYYFSGPYVNAGYFGLPANQSMTLSHEFQHAMQWDLLRYYGNLWHLGLWNYGQDILGIPFGVASALLSGKAYAWLPQEAAAFTMMRAAEPNIWMVPD